MRAGARASPWQAWRAGSCARSTSITGGILSPVSTSRITHPIAGISGSVGAAMRCAPLQTAERGTENHEGGPSVERSHYEGEGFAPTPRSPRRAGRPLNPPAR